MFTIKVDPDAPPEQLREALAPAAEALRAGGVVAFPTETVYGLGANALDEDAVARIFAAKGRPATNPLIVHVSSVARARELVTSWPEDAARLAEAMWPGPLTLVLPRRDVIPDIVTAGLPSVAIRVPRHPVARALIEAAGVPICAPSANRYTEVSPTRAEHVARALSDRIDGLVDAGPADVGVESTVVSLLGDELVILRPGMLGQPEIQSVVRAHVALGAGRVDEGEAAASPGMARKHYSPRAAVRLVDAVDLDDLDAGEGALLCGALPERGLPEGALVFALPDEPNAYARGLYDALHRADEAGCQVLLVERPPQGEPWRAIHDRLARASS